MQSKAKRRHKVIYPHSVYLKSVYFYYLSHLEGTILKTDEPLELFYQQFAPEGCSECSPFLHLLFQMINAPRIQVKRVKEYQQVIHDTGKMTSANITQIITGTCHNISHINHNLQQ